MLLCLTACSVVSSRSLEAVTGCHDVRADGKCISEVETVTSWDSLVHVELYSSSFSVKRGLDSRSYRGRVRHGKGVLGVDVRRSVEGPIELAMSMYSARETDVSAGRFKKH